MCFRLPAHQLRVVIKSIYQLHEILSWHDNTSSERMDGNVSNMQLPQLLIPFLHFYWSGWSWFRFLHMPHVYFAFKRCIGRYWTTWCLSICSLTHYYFKPFTKCTDSDQNLKLAKKCPWLRDHSLLKVLIYKGSKGRDMEFQSEQDFVTELAMFKSTNALYYGAKCSNMKCISTTVLTGVCFTVYYHQDFSTLCADNQLLCILCINAYATVYFAWPKLKCTTPDLRFSFPNGSLPPSHLSQRGGEPSAATGFLQQKTVEENARLKNSATADV